MTRFMIGIVLALSLAPAPAERFAGAALQISSMGPAGDPAYSAFAPTIAFNSVDNEFLVVWTGTSPLVPRSLYGQRIDALTRAEVGANDFLVAASAGTNGPPAVAYNPDDNEFLVVWVGPFASGAEVFGQWLAADGTPAGATVRITQMTSGVDPLMRAYDAAITYNGDQHEYLLVLSGRTGYWYMDPTVRGAEKIQQYPRIPGVFAQRLSADGANVGGLGYVTRVEPDLSSTPQLQPYMPVSAVYNRAAGEYLTVFKTEDNRDVLLAQRLTSTAAGLGPQITVVRNRILPYLLDPALAVNEATGGYGVFWIGDAGDLPYPIIVGQLLGSAGQHIGAAFPLTREVYQDRALQAAFDSATNEFVVVWERPLAGSSGAEAPEIYGQRLSADGREIGPNDFRISHMGPDGDPAYGAFTPAIAFAPASGEHLIVWSGDDNTNGHVDDEFEIYGQFYIPSDPYVIGLASSSADGGWMQQRDDAPSLAARGWVQVPWADYNASGGGTHPAMGDVDGDGRDEIVVGLDASGGNWIVILDDRAHGHAVLRWIRLLWPYNGVPLYPAVGDIDGDGRAEIVVGLGPGTGGWFYLLDDAATGFVEIGWRQVDWPTYAAGDGRTHPAIGDVDGDGSAEIVIGLGPGSAGWVEVFNGAAGGYSHRAWLHLPWEGYNAINGTTWPTSGDVDGDGADEIVLGLGPGGDGWIAVLDDQTRGFATLRWLQIDWGDYSASSGETHPAVGNIDGDAAAEIIAGLGTWSSSEGGWYELFDDLIANLGSAGFAWRQIDWGGYNATGGGTYPAIARSR